MLVVGMVAASIFNLLFQMVMGRALSPDEYALLVMFLSVFSVFSLPLSVVSVSLSRYSSLLAGREHMGDVRRLIRYWGIRMAAIGCALSSVCFLFPNQIARLVDLDRPAPVLIFGSTLIGVFCRPVVLGALLGIQRFGSWSLCTVFGAASRVLVGAALVWCVSPFAGWGLLGHGIGFYGAMVLGLVLLWTYLRGTHDSGAPLPNMRGYVLSSFFILLGYAILMTADVVVVKQRFPDMAGDFAYAATLARLVLLAPQALVGAMFPKVVGQQKRTREQHRLLRKTLAATLLCSVGSACVISLFAPLFANWIFGIGDPSADLVRWCRLLSWAMVPVALLNVPTRFAMAQHRLAAAALVPVAALCYLAWAYLLAVNPDGLVIALCGIACAAVVGLGALVGFGSTIPAESDGDVEP